MKNLQAFAIILLLSCCMISCEKERIEAIEEPEIIPEEEELVQFYDDSIHVGKAIDQDSTVWDFEAYAHFAHHETGLYPLNLFHRYVPGNPRFYLALDIVLPRVDTPACYILKKSMDRYLLATEYPSAVFVPVEEDAILDAYQLSEEKVSTVCITDISDEDPEYSGTFELHFIKPPVDPRFPWLEVRFADTLSFYNGEFRAGQFYR